MAINHISILPFVILNICDKIHQFSPTPFMQFFDDDNEKGDNMIKKLLQPFRFHGRHKIDFCLIARPWLQLF